MRRTSRFATLWRTFCQQFVGEASESEAAYRQRLVLVVAALVVPAFFILIALFPDFTDAVIRARFHRAPPSIIDDRLEWLIFVLTTYAMVGTGFVTVLAWESLAFTARDALVLGPLPLRPRTLLWAKLAALASLFATVAVPIAVLHGAFFTLETTLVLSPIALVLRLAITVVTLLAASLFAFAVVVVVRGAAVLALGPRRAGGLGPPLQFLCVLGLMSLVVLSPAVWQTHVMTVRVTDALPPAWFVGVFEQLRGSPRADWPEFLLHAHRAMAMTPLIVGAALGLSTLTFQQQMRAALTPAVPAAKWTVSAQLRRVATGLAGRSPVARAIADFVVLTLSRSRAHQQPLAVGTALGAAIAMAQLTRWIHSLADVWSPRAVTLCVPLILGYGALLGLRRAFTLPRELAAAWTFRLFRPTGRATVLRGVRAAVYAIAILPMSVATATVFAGLIGWQDALWHTAVLVGIMAVVTESVLVGLDTVPFTQGERPPQHAAPVWWVVYALGMAAFVYGPGRLESAAFAEGRTPVVIVAMSMVLAVAIAWLGQRKRPGLRVNDADDDVPRFGDIALLSLNE